MDKRRIDTEDPNVKKLREDFELQAKFEKELADEEKRTAQDFMKRLQWERREAAFDDKLHEVEESALIKQKQMHQQGKLAAEMDMTWREEFTAEKERQRIRENAHELKLLETQLRAAYVNKGLQTQIKEKELQRLEEKQRDKRAQELLVKACGEEEDRLNKIKKKETDDKEAMRIQLQDQITEKEKRRQEKFVEYMNEKAFMDEVAKQMKDEETRQMEEKKKLQEKMRQEMEQFQLAREMSKTKQKMAIEEENKKLKEVDTGRQEDDLMKKREREARIARAEAMGQKVADKIMEKRKAEEERRDMISQLVLAEKEDKDMEAEKQAEIDENQKRQNGRIEYNKVMTEKQRKKKEEMEQDRLFAEQTLLKNQEELQKEQQREADKRNQRIQDRLYNQRAMQEKRERHAEEIKLTQLAIEMENKAEQERMERIETERISMLKQHVPYVKRHFPKGALAKSDWEALGIACNSPRPPDPTQLCSDSSTDQ